MDRRARLAGFVGSVVVAAALAGVIVRSVFPAIGVSDLYGTAITSAVGAAVIASFWVLLGDGFEAEEYIAPRCAVVDAALVIGRPCSQPSCSSPVWTQPASST